MFLSLSTWVLSKSPIYGIFKDIRELGFENIEFNLSCIEQSEDSIYQVRELILENDLNCSSVHGVGFYVKSPDEIKEAIYYGKRSIDLAETLLSDIVVVHSYVSDRLSTESRRDILKRVFSELYDYSIEKGVKLAVENLSKGSRGYGKNVKELGEIFDISDLSLTIDFCHAKTTSQIFALIEAYKKRLKNVHISNDLHRPIRKLNPQLDLFLMTLIQNDYKGPITIELNPRYRKRITETKLILEDYLKNYPLIHLR